MKKYNCTVTSDFSLGREYENICTSSALKAAEKFGRCEGGEKVIVYTSSGKIVSCAFWSSEDNRYYRAYVSADERI